MYQNRVTAASMLTVSSEKRGVVGLAVKEGTGSATAEASGTYSGSEDLRYTVEIDSVAGGAEVGQATFRWKDGTGDWNASEVTTSTAPVSLNNAVSIKFASGSGADFVLADKWTFIARKPYGRAKLIDLNRNSEFRTRGLGDNPHWIKADLGAALQVQAFVLLDHNLTSGATITLQANSADDWGAPPYSQAVTWTAGTLCLFLDQTYRWWRLTISDDANPAGYLRASEFYLGAYLEFGILAPVQPSRKRNVFHETSSRSLVGVERPQALSRWREWDLRVSHLDAGQIASLRGVFEALRDYSAQRVWPCYFTPKATVPAETYLGYLDAVFEENLHLDTALGQQVGFREQVRAGIW
jgi:hypothetical protein